MIKVENMYKRYGTFTALKGLNLEVPEGVIYGFVGPNGAGKTTLMRILSTLMKPSAGKAYVDGEDVVKQPNAVRRKIGYMPDFFGVYDNLKVNEYLDFYGDAQGVEKAGRRKMARELLEIVALSDKYDTYVDSLSRGMKQRLCLARSLMHDPKLLILDEPASGMDPRARAEMKAILRTLRGMGKTILISSHILPELSELCDQMGIIQNGQILLSGTMDEIAGKLGAQQPIKIKLADRIDEAVASLRQLPEVMGIEQDMDTLTIGFRIDDLAQASLLKRLIDEGFTVVDFHRAASNLEQIFLEVTQDEYVAQSGA